MVTIKYNQWNNLMKKSNISIPILVFFLFCFVIQIITLAAFIAGLNGSLLAFNILLAIYGIMLIFIGSRYDCI